MKYIVSRGEAGLEKMDIFCDEDNHAVKAEQTGILEGVISAGFISFDTDGVVHCGGYSESLTRKLKRDIASRGEADERVFKFRNKMANKGVTA
jgi:hypothetical protein